MIDWRRFMGSAIFYLRWSPDVFWASTMAEYQAAAEEARRAEPGAG
ncbi:MAG: hypothetical protein CFK52_14035 [Chloracidobacterium sp. CP2_5A]|nr:MAG: hypothetical protein CFK52_14035 [Chloracidobacterium sp. CP2_5A]